MSRAIVTTLGGSQDRSDWAFAREGWESYARRCGAVVVEHVPPAGKCDASRRDEIASCAVQGFDLVLLVDPWVRVSSFAPSIFDAHLPGLPAAVLDGGLPRPGVCLVSPLTDTAVPTRPDEARPLDPRFNASWARERQRRFPFLLSCAGHRDHAKCIGHALADAYFLNFVGATEDLALEPSMVEPGREVTARTGQQTEGGLRVRAVALFLYNRPDLTSQVFSAIRDAKPRRLFLIADGPDPARPEDALRCDQAKQGLVVDWECEVVRDFSGEHLGPRLRVESGFRVVFDEVEEAIFLEDDLLPSPEFFSFCEELLAFHRRDDRVLSIGGSALHFGMIRSEASYHFSRYPTSWGWATWKRAIEQYQPERPRPDWAHDTLDWLRLLLDDPRAADYWARLFEPTGGRPTWDHVWARSGFLAGGLHVVPARNLVSNLGFRSDATHTRRPSPFANLPVEPLAFPLVHPPVERSRELDAFLEETVYSGNLVRALEQVRRRVADHRARAQ